MNIDLEAIAEATRTVFPGYRATSETIATKLARIIRDVDPTTQGVIDALWHDAAEFPDNDRPTWSRVAKRIRQTSRRIEHDWESAYVSRLRQVPFRYAKEIVAAVDNGNANANDAELWFDAMVKLSAYVFYHTRCKEHLDGCPCRLGQVDWPTKPAPLTVAAIERNAKQQKLAEARVHHLLADALATERRAREVQLGQLWNRFRALREIGPYTREQRAAVLHALENEGHRGGLVLEGAGQLLQESPF